MMTAQTRMPSMLLSELLQGMVEFISRQEIAIQRLILDSRQVQPGDLFIAIPGYTVDGRKFIDDAITRGAVAIVWHSEPGSEPIPIHWRPSPEGGSLPVIAIENLNHKVGVLADRFYAEPSNSLYTIGITGTNGKTSTSQFIAQALNASKTCGVMGTMGWGFLPDLHEASHTTPDAISCHRQLAALRDNDAHAVAMEVSSHALDQGRVSGVHFDCAVFTNLTHEHLDYHGDMQSYAAAKARLFHWPQLQCQVINQDDAYGRELIQQCPANCKLYTYGIDQFNGVPDIYADDIHYHRKGISLHVHSPKGEGKLDVALFGQFNIYNLLAALGVLLDAGLDFKTALQRLASLKPVGGRMQVVITENRPVVIVDYAHTPDALQQILSAARQHEFGRLWLVFGCGGDRDRGKRPVMGAIAESFADKVVLTNDNPRHESPQSIIDQIRDGIKNTSAVHEDPDRARAIQYALHHAQATDVVIVAGKGHETYQQVGDEKLPFSDVNVVTAFLSGAKP